MAFQPHLVDLLDPRGFARQKSYSDLLEADSVRRSRDLASDYEEASAPDRLAGLRGQNRARDVNTDYEAQTLPSRVSKVRDEAAASTRGREFLESLPPWMVAPQLAAPTLPPHLQAFGPQQAPEQPEPQAGPNLPPQYGPQMSQSAETNLPPYYLRPEVPAPAAFGPVPSRDQALYEAMRAGAMGPDGYFQETRPKEPAKPGAPQFETGEDQFSYVWNPVTKQWDKTNLRMPKPVHRPASGPKEPKPLTEQAYNAALYGRRMEQAIRDMDSLAKEGFDRTSYVSGILSGKYVPNFLTPGKLQAQQQAERNFINAVLRRESGATIQATEFASAEKQYFPRSGDSEKVLEQKKRNREIALQGLRVASGRAWDETGGSGSMSSDSDPLGIR